MLVSAVRRSHRRCAKVSCSVDVAVLSPETFEAVLKLCLRSSSRHRLSSNKYIVALKSVNPQIDDLGIEQMIDFEFVRWFKEYPSSSASTGQPQQHVEELQHEVPTNPPQQQGTIDSTSVDSSAIIPIGRDLTDGKLWIQPCGQSFHPSIQPVRVIRKVITSKFEEPHHVWSQKNFKWLPQYEDRIKACWNFKADERFRGLMKEVRLAWKEGQKPAWMPEECLHEANEESNAAIKQLQENYKKEIDELKKLIISSRNQHEQDDEA
ncbi:uncharacterized protein G2W53_021960 [Senna tora]|uniref:Uncharacterized protein n=1 Tax=Senna tora TaxID=362788 RepID=A0A834TMP3_9FABA|nr:uncharacterized protein G2W53_021960 [Senna tora]